MAILIIRFLAGNARRVAVQGDTYRDAATSTQPCARFAGILSRAIMASSGAWTIDRVDRYSMALYTQPGGLDEYLALEYETLPGTAS
jgi:hypothetical protein